VSDPLAADRVGVGWYPVDSGIRWMGRAAGVRMPGPRAAGQRLNLTAICPAGQVRGGPLELSVTVDGVRLGPAEFTKGDVWSTVSLALPAEAVGKSDIEVAVGVGHTVRIGLDRRDLGLAFGQFEIR